MELNKSPISNSFLIILLVLANCAPAHQQTNFSASPRPPESPPTAGPLQTHLIRLAQGLSVGPDILGRICSEEKSTLFYAFPPMGTGPTKHTFGTTSLPKENQPITVTLNTTAFSEAFLRGILTPTEIETITRRYGSIEKFYDDVMLPFSLKHELLHGCTSFWRKMTVQELSQIFILDGDYSNAEISSGGFNIEIKAGNSRKIYRGLEEFFTIYLNYILSIREESDPFLNHLYYKFSIAALSKNSTMISFFDLLVTLSQKDPDFPQRIMMLKNESNVADLINQITNSLVNSNSQMTSYNPATRQIVIFSTSGEIKKITTSIISRIAVAPELNNFHIDVNPIPDALLGALHYSQAAGSNHPLDTGTSSQRHKIPPPHTPDRTIRYQNGPNHYCPQKRYYTF